VDGAFGALAALAPDSVSQENRRRLGAMARADSLGFDLHKWMYMPYDVGCVLVRDSAMHHATFSLTPSYLQRATRGLAAGDYWPSDYGMQLSRGFRALKAWMLLKEHGVEAYGAQIRKNVAQAAYLAALVDEAPDLERVAPAPLNIVCFRYVGTPARNGEALNALNRELLVRLQESGVAFPTNAIIGGRYAIRVAISNHRSRRDDFELLVDEVQRLGRALEREMGGGA
jgi:glutamate/tyrosine decarboxylase-like PLP-dependent enzyme